MKTNSFFEQMYEAAVEARSFSNQLRIRILTKKLWAFILIAPNYR